MAHPSKNVQVFDTSGKPYESMSFPSVFSAPFRPDMIRKVVVALQSRSYQPKGRDPMAGKRTTAHSRGVGYGMARIPRLDRTLTGKFAPMTVKGRSTHPPRAEKVIRKGINRKEKLLAFHSALSATAMPQAVRTRGHILGEKGLPMVVS